MHKFPAFPCLNEYSATAKNMLYKTPKRSMTMNRKYILAASVSLLFSLSVRFFDLKNDSVPVMGGQEYEEKASVTLADLARELFEGRERR